MEGRSKKRPWQFLTKPRQVPGWVLLLTLAVFCGLLLYQRFQSDRKTREQWASKTRESPDSLEEPRQLPTTRLGEEGIRHLERAMERLVDSSNQFSPGRAHALNLLGNLYVVQDKEVDKAEEMYRQSLALYEEYLDPEHRDIAIVKANVEAAVAKRREKDVEK